MKIISEKQLIESMAKAKLNLNPNGLNGYWVRFDGDEATRTFAYAPKGFMPTQLLASIQARDHLLLIMKRGSKHAVFRELKSKGIGFVEPSIEFPDRMEMESLE